MPFYSLFLPFLLLLLPVPWLGYLLIFLVLVGIKPFFFFFFHNPNSILDAGGLVCKRREGTRYAMLGDFSLFLLLLLPFFPHSLRLPCSLVSRAVRAAKHKLHETATSGTRLNTTVHKKFKAEEEQAPQKKNPQNTTQFWNSLKNFSYNPGFEEILKTKKTKNRQNFRRISTKVFFQRNKRLMSSSTTTTTIHTGHWSPGRLTFQASKPKPQQRGGLGDRVVPSSSKLFTKTRTKEKEIPRQPNLVSLQLRRRRWVKRVHQILCNRNSLLRNLGESAKAGKKKKEKGGEEEEHHQNRPAYFPTFLLL